VTPRGGLKFCIGVAIGEGGVDPELRGSISSPGNSSAASVDPFFDFAVNGFYIKPNRLLTFSDVKFK